MSAEIINGREIAKTLRSEILKEVENLKLQYKVVPNISTIKIGNNCVPDAVIVKKIFIFFGDFFSQISGKAG